MSADYPQKKIDWKLIYFKKALSDFAAMGKAYHLILDFKSDLHKQSADCDCSPVYRYIKRLQAKAWVHKVLAIGRILGEFDDESHKEQAEKILALLNRKSAD